MRERQVDTYWRREEDEKMQWAGYGIEKGMVHVVSRRPLLFCKVLFPLFAAWGGVGAT